MERQAKRKVQLESGETGETRESVDILVCSCIGSICRCMSVNSIVITCAGIII